MVKVVIDHFGTALLDQVEQFLLRCVAEMPGQVQLDRPGCGLRSESVREQLLEESDVLGLFHDHA